MNDLSNVTSWKLDDKHGVLPFVVSCLQTINIDEMPGKTKDNTDKAQVLKGQEG